MWGERLPRLDPPVEGVGIGGVRGEDGLGLRSVGLSPSSLPLIEEIGLSIPSERGETFIDRSVGDEGPDWLGEEGANGSELRVDDLVGGVCPIRRSMGEGCPDDLRELGLCGERCSDGSLKGEVAGDGGGGIRRAGRKLGVRADERRLGYAVGSSFGTSAGSSTGAVEEPYIS